MRFFSNFTKVDKIKNEVDKIINNKKELGNIYEQAKLDINKAKAEEINQRLKNNTKINRTNAILDQMKSKKNEREATATRPGYYIPIVKLQLILLLNRELLETIRDIDILRTDSSKNRKKGIEKAIEFISEDKITSKYMASIPYLSIMPDTTITGPGEYVNNLLLNIGKFQNGKQDNLDKEIDVTTQIASLITTKVHPNIEDFEVHTEILNYAMQKTFIARFRSLDLGNNYESPTFAAQMKQLEKLTHVKITPFPKEEYPDKEIGEKKKVSNTNELTAVLESNTTLLDKKIAKLRSIIKAEQTDDSKRKWQQNHEKNKPRNSVNSQSL